MLAPKVKIKSCNCHKFNEDVALPEFKFSKPQEKRNLVVSFYKKPEKQKNKTLF